MKKSYLFCGVILFALAGCNVSQKTSSSESQSSEVSSVIDPNALRYHLNSAETSYEVAANNRETISGDLVIPDLYQNKPVTTIYIGGFTDTNITSVKMPKYLTEIEFSAFNQCKKLTHVTFNDGILTIESLSFALCTSLDNITLPEDLTTMGNRVFYDCDALSKITLPNKLKTIGEDAFKDCSSLKFVDTGDSLKTISEGCFSHCVKLEAIRISNKITSISEKAFNECPTLAKVYYSGTEAEWNTISISEKNESLVNADKYYYSETEPTSQGHYWHYIDNEITEW